MGRDEKPSIQRRIALGPTWPRSSGFRTRASYRTSCPTRAAGCA